ncbi:MULTISPECIES: DNA/RNA non-specific endonuclease [unclassified Microcoleus]|uniref:DNA/RNA non-specific endonuclease n=1 Tax=unclassified Microcoleus TaxID=2642155 RepID=UPI0025F8C952|nr:MULTISPECIES: DNA/RNA non-specific endonuclease [unclassified Microcoleus]
MTDKSRKLANNQFEIAVQVPNTVPLGESRIVISRKQNEKVSPKPSEAAKEVKYDSSPYRIENNTAYIFAAQWTADKVAIINGANPKSVVAATNSSDLSVASVSVGTDDILDRPRELTVTSDGSRAYVVMDRSGRVAVVDPMTRQQIDTQPNTAGINPINLPSGAEGRSIVIDPRDEYAYIADGKAGGNSIYVLDINPFSSKYHQVTQTITVGAAPSGLRQMAISSDGKKLFVTAPNGANSKIYAVNIDPKDRPSDPSQNPKKWNQLIANITADEGLEGLAATVNPLKMTFTNSGKDSKGFGVLDITNNDPVSFAATTRYASLGLGSTFDYFDVNEGVSVTVLPDASYAFVVGRNADTKFFGQEIPSIDGDPRAGSNIGIIKDPLTNPQLVAATRPIPNGFATDLVLSSDSKYLYASYPNLSGANGKVYVFDTQEFIRTVTNPGQFQIDAKGRGVGLPLFNSATARNATVADLAAIPIDNINPAVSIAADFQILTDANNQYTYGVPPGSKKAPVSVTNPRGLAATPLDWLDLKEPIGTSKSSENPLNPKFQWSFDSPPNQDITEVNLFVSVFDEGEGLLPWDKVVDLPDPNGNKFLFDQGLSKPQQLDLLTKPWNTSSYRKENDFNPNRILTATWQKDSTNIGKWTFDGGKTFTQGSNTSFTLPPSLKLTAGQKYNWAVEAWNKEGKRNEEFGNFWTPLPPALNGDNTFSSVTVLTHGFKPPFLDKPGIPSEFYQMGNSIANAGIDGGGLMMKYDLPTGYWVPVNKFGAVAPDFQAGLNPKTDPNYLTKLGTYIAPYLAQKQPLVLLNNWSENNESAVPDSCFTEAAADAFFTSLVQLDGVLKNKTSPTKQGAVFNSPLHFVGFSRGTVVNSEIIQRLGTHFPDAGGKPNSGTRDLQMTTLDPHDFNQPSLNVVTKNFGDFREPKVQVWKNVTFADNYYQTVPNLLSGTLTPAGRNIPNLPSTENGTAPGLKFPREGWRSDNPNPNGKLLGEPDLSVFLGTNKNNPGYNNSRAGFTTDPIPGDVHGRVVSWYGGTSDLFPTNFPSDQNLEVNPVFRRRGDGYRERLFDKDFSFNNSVVTGPARVSPWYTPESKFQHGADAAPWEGIGTGWFYSALGGGYSSRPKTNVERIPVDFDNTYDARMRGDAAVPTLFNGNFDAVFDPKGVTRTPLSTAIPGWSFHGGGSNIPSPTDRLVDWSTIPSLSNYRTQVGYSPAQPNYALELKAGENITHNRFIAPDWGNLRFDIHAPNRSGLLNVTFQSLDGKIKIEEQIDLATAIKIPTDMTDSSQLTMAYLNNQNRVKFGEEGFETFQLNLQIRNDLTKQYRGQPAIVKFELAGGKSVYLDNVFFKSDYLKWGNPTEARWDFNKPNENPYQTNLLLEKPQYASSYNAVTKLPNWVSWKVDKTWNQQFKGRTGDQFIVDPNLPGSPNFPSWPRIDGEIYRGTGLDKGHLIPDKDRNRNEKDALSTYMSTNLIPQAIDNNRLFRNRNNGGRLDPDISPAWSRIESKLVEQLIFDYDKQLYITAGVFDTKQQNWSIQPKTRAPEALTEAPNQGNTNPTNLESNGIRIPGWTWKTILVSNKSSLGVQDILGSYTYITPNVPEPYTDWSGKVAVQNPLNQLLGENRDPITSAEQWRRPNTWKISINQLENLLNTQGSDKIFNFLSNIPENVRKRIKKQSDFQFPPP